MPDAGPGPQARIPGVVRLQVYRDYSPVCLPWVIDMTASAPSLAWFALDIIEASASAQRRAGQRLLARSSPSGADHQHQERFNHLPDVVKPD